MKSFYTLVLSALLIIMVTSGALAMGKTLVDPNEGYIPEKTDSRLAQKITCSLEKQSVVKILNILSTMTGVTLNAGYNDQDWQVRDRRMIVFIKDMPLQELMTSIARVMNFKWKKSGDGDQAVYRLYMDRAAVISAEMRKQKEEEYAARKLAEARWSLVNTFATSDDWANQDSEVLKNQNPYLYALAESGTADAMSRLFSERPDLKSALSIGNQLEIDSSKLSKDGKEALRDLFRGLHRVDHQYGRNYKDYPEVPKSVGDDKDNITLYLNKYLGEGDVAQVSLESANRSDFRSRFEFRDPNSPAAKLEGEFISEIWDGDRSFEEIKHQFSQKISEAPIPERTAQRRIGEDDQVQHADDPDLKQEKENVITPFKLYSHNEFARTVAETFDMNVISDFFAGDNGGSTFGIYGQDTKGITMSLGYLLSRIEGTCNVNWWKRGKTIELRKKNWYSLRIKQIPEAWLENWRQAFKDTGTLDIDSLGFMAQLSLDQYVANIAPDKILNGYKGDDGPSEIQFIVRRNDINPFLRFYSALTARQQESIFSEKGLSLLNIRSDKQPALEKWLGLPTSLKSPLNPENGVTALLLYGTREQVKKVFKYRFEIKADKGNGLQKWDSISFTTPTYVEPKKAEIK